MGIDVIRTDEADRFVGDLIEMRRIILRGDNGRTSTCWASASITSTVRVLCRVTYRVGWMMDRGLNVPTATLGSSGVNRKKFFGLITTCRQT